RRAGRSRHEFGGPQRLGPPDTRTGYCPAPTRLRRGRCALGPRVHVPHRPRYAAIGHRPSRRVSRRAGSALLHFAFLRRRFDRFGLLARAHPPTVAARTLAAAWLPRRASAALALPGAGPRRSDWHLESARRRPTVSRLLLPAG